MREDSGGTYYFTCGIHNGDFHAGTQTRIQPHSDFCTGGCSHQQIVEVLGKDVDGLFLGFFAQLTKQFGFHVQRDFNFPGPLHNLCKPAICRAALVTDIVVLSN